MSLNSFFHELQRRNVLKAAISYIAVSWLILQAASIIFPALSFSQSAIKILLIALSVGFPFWLIFSWIFEYTPKGFKQTEKVKKEESISTVTGKRLNTIIISVMALAILLLLLDRIFNITEQLLNPKAELSIAVLPFENIGGEDDDYFTLGMSEDILTQLGKIELLRVLSRFTLKDYNTNGKTPSMIGKELKVSYLLTGSVRKVAQALRISCQLINTRNGAEVWSEKFDKNLNDVFQIQSEVAEQIAAELKAELSDEEKTRIETIPTENLVAYNIYLKGRESYNHYELESNEKAISYFRDAIQLDSTFSLAWAGLSAAYSQSIENYGNRPHSFADTALVMAEKSITLNEDIAEGWKSLGDAYSFKGNARKAKESFRMALEKNPNYYVAINNLTNILRDDGELVEAIHLYEKAISINPINGITYLNLGYTYYLLGLYDQAIEKLEMGVKLAEQFWGGYYWLAFPYLSMADFDEVNKSVHLLQSNNIMSAKTLQYLADLTYKYDQKQARVFVNLAISSADYDRRNNFMIPLIDAFLLTKTGMSQKAEEILADEILYYSDKLNKGHDNIHDILNMSKIYGILGDTEQCLKYIERAIAQGDKDYRNYEIDPMFDHVRNDPRFLRLISSVKDEVSEMRAEVLSSELGF